jgi:hypothetical protein
MDPLLKEKMGNGPIVEGEGGEWTHCWRRRRVMDPILEEEENNGPIFKEGGE